MSKAKEVKRFTIESSAVNEAHSILVAHTKKGKFVVSGDHWHPTYLVPYDKAFDVKTREEVEDEN